MCVTCEGEEVSSLLVALREESSKKFLWVQSLRSEGGTCQKRAWDKAVGVPLEMTFPPEITDFLVLIKFGALGCILQYFQP